MIPRYALHDEIVTCRIEPLNLDPPRLRIKKLFGIKMPKIQIGRALKAAVPAVLGAAGGIFGGPGGAAVGGQAGNMFTNLFKSRGASGGGGAAGFQTQAPPPAPGAPGSGAVASAVGFLASMPPIVWIVLIGVLGFFLIRRR
jgi:hypothetical protein